MFKTIRDEISPGNIRHRMCLCVHLVSDRFFLYQKGQEASRRSLLLGNGRSVPDFYRHSRLGG